MSACRSRRELNEAINALPPPHPATDPTAAAPQPAPLDLDAAVRRAQQAIAAVGALTNALEMGHPDPPQHDWDDAIRAACQVAYKDVPALLAEVRRLRAPAGRYELPAEPPPEVVELWDRHGRRWERQEVLGHVRWRRRFSDGSLIIRTWPELLPYGPLSTTPPAGTEGER